ncbi:MAG: 23S rRNA (pseudouridine(1915)-N(3))-methyltransferase RlmH [bacterium]
MLSINIILIGKNKDPWVTDGCAHYEKLLSRFANISWSVIVSPKKISSLSPAELKVKEGELIIQTISKGTVIALADSGKKVDSHRFAYLLDKLHTTSGGTINMIIGGAYGLDQTVLDRAELVLSLSPLTFSHQLVRLVLLEQLYRAFSILHNTDYHK